MNRPLLYILLLMFASFISCERESGIAEESEDAVSLEIFLSVPEVSISTKGMEDPWDEDLTDWTNWDIFTDGRAIYELTLLLINSDGDLVGFRDMYAPGSGDNKYVDSANGIWDGSQVLDESTVSGKEFKASFLYDTPQGDRSVEKLKRGVYTLLAVSNYRPITASVTGTTAYEGLKGAIGSSMTIDTPFTDIIEEIETEYIANNGITDFKNSTLYQNLWTFNIVTDYNNLCHRQPQPLTAVREIELIPGKNTIHLGLERTYVRVRVEIENNSSTETLTVDDFDFCDWFTQRAVYLFNDPKDNSRNYDISSSGLNTSKQSPILKNETGIVNGNNIDGNGYSNAIVDVAKSKPTIDPGSSIVLFDGYMFGSKLGADDPDTYQYSLEIQYADVTGYNSYSLGDAASVITDVAELNTYYDAASTNRTFLIQNQNNQYRFLYNGVTETTVTTKDVEFDHVKSMFEQLSPESEGYLWKLERSETGNNDYYILTAGATPYYMGIPHRDANIGLQTVKGPYYTFADPDDNSDRIVMKSSQINTDSSYDYINVYGGEQEKVRGWSDDDAGSQFVFYPVDSGLGYPYLNSEIDLELIDPVTAAVYPVQNIKRNDFINILISVTYVPTSNQFEIENMVKGWSQKDMNIEFH